ncbi:MAG: hypothetical protein ABIR30_13625 [Chitinophagaceae bacterium]
MKVFKTSTENLIKLLRPDLGRFEDTVTPYCNYSQKEFSSFLEKLNLDIEGEISNDEALAISSIKKSLHLLTIKNHDVPIDRMEFDYAIIFHKELKKVGYSKNHIDNHAMWRWMSLNHFLKEVLARRAQKLIDRKDLGGAAKSIFTHCFGEKTRDIFPRRYFLIGERLHDKEKGYALLEKLAEKSRFEKSGGFGNLINNIIETSLLSPNDFVSKIMAKILLTGGKPADDKQVAKAFVRYNGFKKRLLSSAVEQVFEQEVCLL